METSGEQLSSRKSERTWNRRLRDSLTFDSYRCIFLVSNFNQNLFATKMASFNCSFKGYSKKDCGVSARYKEHTTLVPLNTCTKDVSGHLSGCYKTTAQDIDGEWKLCLLRVGLFHENGDSLTICPLHRDEFGFGWRPSKACKYPLHDSKQKPVRGVTKRMSEEIFNKWNILCQIGQGNV